MTLKEYKDKRVNNPDFAEAYEELQLKMNVIRALVDARTCHSITQKKLCERADLTLRHPDKKEN